MDSQEFAGVRGQYAIKVVELTAVANYIDSTGRGAKFAATLTEAARLLEKARGNVCKQGYFGCRGGASCTSDHK